MPDILLAKNMLESLERDFREAAKSPSRHVGHVNLKDYKEKFGVNDEDIEAYCQTLAPLTPVYPACPMCGGKWSYEEDGIKIRPISNGHILDWVDSFQTFCTNEDHDALWYFQHKDGRCSFDREVEDLDGHSYQVRWNCGCMEPACYGKNVVFEIIDRYHYTDLKVIKYFDSPIPINISREELHQLIIGSR